MACAMALKILVVATVIAAETAAEIGAKQEAKPAMMATPIMVMAVIAAARQKWAVGMFVGIITAQDLKILITVIMIAAIVEMEPALIHTQAALKIVAHAHQIAAVVMYAEIGAKQEAKPAMMATPIMVMAVIVAARQKRVVVVMDM